ncbi:hypothetical protein [Sulfitobacter sp. S190]|uniref:hypothetical protein n=1 Tax=Sulfitobacter sp. S190 TaxID=2867022 RepID=UPI0021A3E9B5|nr:hypothetical protein [Sulfitobacter sp. S190]UWR23074.1 hypothetical protein K3756_03490 [Sulfitobacter sp. S190]
MTAPLAVWRPTRAVFIRRTVMLTAISLLLLTLILLPFAYAVENWLVLLIGPVFVLLYASAFEDPSRWRSLRHDKWELEHDRLTYVGGETQLSIPLADITDARARFGWHVVLKLKSGMRAEMQFMRHPRLVATQILSTRNSMVI